MTRLADGVLPYASLGLRLGSRLTVMTAPNGGGKCNIGRALCLLRLPLYGSCTGDWRPLTTKFGKFGKFRNAGCYGHDGYTVRLDAADDGASIGPLKVWTRGPAGHVSRVTP